MNQTVNIKPTQKNIQTLHKLVERKNEYRKKVLAKVTAYKK